MNQTIKSRNLWPVAIIAFFIVFATFLAIFVVWALGQKQDLVAENYYEQEVRYQEQLDRLYRTQAQSSQTTVKFDVVKNCIMIQLPAAQAAGASGKIQLYRPSNAKLDHEVPLAIDAGGVQALDAKAMAAGLWKVRIEWIVNGQEYFFDQAVVVTGALTSESARSPNTAINSRTRLSTLL